MPGNDLVFYGTTGPSGIADGNPSTPNPANWLGRFRAPNALHELQSTLTANQTTESRHIIVDSARIGDGVQAHQLKWIAMQTGGAALSAARVSSFDDATGTFVLDRQLGPSNGAIGDDYAIFDVNNVWPDVTAAQAAAGEDRYRCISIRNQHGVSVTNGRIFFRVLSAGGADFSRIHQASVLQPYIQRATDQDDILDVLGQRDPQGGPDNFSGSGGWQNPFGTAVADTVIASMNNLGSSGIWLRRRIPAGIRFRNSIAVQIIFETDIGGSDPDPLAGTAVMPYDVLGGAISGSIEPDRYLHIGGGTRLNGIVLADAVPLPGREVQWTLRPGDVGDIETDDDPLVGYDVTSDDGETAATYVSPTLQSLAGADVAPRILVGDGDEVGNPQPRVNVAGSTTFSYTATGTLSIPALEQTFQDDPGTGWWPSI